MNKLLLLYANNGSCLGIDSEGNEHPYEKTAGEIISGWCILHACTMHGRQEAAAKMFGWHQKIPVLISEITQEIWFPVAGGKAADNVWICCDAVFSFHRAGDHQTRIVFLSGVVAVIDCDVRTVRLQMKRCRQLTERLMQNQNGMAPVLPEIR